jgi:hypothetical protein
MIMTVNQFTKADGGSRVDTPTSPAAWLPGGIDEGEAVRPHVPHDVRSSRMAPAIGWRSRGQADGFTCHVPPSILSHSASQNRGPNHNHQRGIATERALDICCPRACTTITGSGRRTSIVTPYRGMVTSETRVAVQTFERSAGDSSVTSISSAANAGLITIVATTRTLTPITKRRDQPL